MKLTSTSFADGERIPAEYAFCAPDPKSHVKLGANRNPQLEWSDLPMGTQSLALICHDYDVPSQARRREQGRPHDSRRRCRASISSTGCSSISTRSRVRSTRASSPTA